ncbi:substrate-binding domain-containing protein [Streptomyces sp. CoH27]|uniref:substrate-binding domain-containing protein n=1 Tax=Streptomyces sp. CoH27 TaxID=2875763 RepID=UPI0035A96CFC
MIAGEPFASTGTDRAAGFLDRYREAGLPVPGHRVRHCSFDIPGGRRAAAELLVPTDRPTALFAVNDLADLADLAALGAMGAARDLGLRPGSDFALVGFNDTPLAAELPIPLTSVHSPMAELGRAAVRRLLHRIAGEPAASQHLRPQLVARASSGAPIGPALGCERRPQAHRPICGVTVVGGSSAHRRAHHPMAMSGRNCGHDGRRPAALRAVPRQGRAQTAYGVELDGADVVRVESGEQIPVPRPFTPLSARTCATVRVRVAFGGRRSARSEPATAETVLLEPGDWPARFITPRALRGIGRSAPGLTRVVRLGPASHRPACRHRARRRGWRGRRNGGGPHAPGDRRKTRRDPPRRTALPPDPSLVRMTATGVRDSAGVGLTAHDRLTAPARSAPASAVKALRSGHLYSSPDLE